MITTPFTATSLGRTRANGDRRLIAPRASSMRGQAWGFLATHWTQDGPASNVHRIVQAIHQGFWLCGLTATAGINGSNILLVFGDGSAVVGHTPCTLPNLATHINTRRPLPTLAKDLDHPIAFSPLLLQAQIGKGITIAEARAAGSLIPRVQTDNATALRGDIADALADAEAIGRVCAPWHSDAVDGVVAPWVLGNGQHPMVPIAIEGAVLGLRLNLPPNIVVETEGFLLDDKGQLAGALMVTIKEGWSYSDGRHLGAEQALETWMAQTWTRPGAPWRHGDLVAQSFCSERTGRRNSKRMPGVLARTTLGHLSAHQALAALGLFRASGQW